MCSVAGVSLSCVSSLCFSLSSKPASKSFGPSSATVLRPSHPCFSLFLSVAKPRSPRQFSPPVGTRCCLHVFHVALSVCCACLGEVPAWFFPFLYSFPCSPALQTEASKSHFSCLRPARERVKLVLFIL